MDGDKRITRCNDHDRFIGGLCQETGRKIKFPISGPIPEDCPLPKAKREEDDEEGGR
jgi:hypothetical protein